MNIVLLSGGSGKRLWPLSNDTLSKQFLKLLQNERGEYESMVQRVMRQLVTTYPDANIFVSSNAAQADLLQSQLGAVDMILEPARRDTFPAISLAAAHLRYKKELNDDDVFIVCPIDVFAEEKYFQLLTDIEALVRSGRHEIGLMGVLPLHPTEKYGYILQKNGVVTGFVEKPPKDEARRLIDGGALWNCGVFALKIGSALRSVRKHVRFESFEELFTQYADIPKISFDYEVVEKEASVGTVVYDGIWKDLGTWQTLTEEMSGNSMGKNILLSGSCKNTHVLNMLNIPIISHDLTDMVFVASHDGILVCSKSGSSELKPLTAQINLRPMYEQRSWGNYRVLEYNYRDGASSFVKRIHIDAGQAAGHRQHLKCGEVWVVISGKGILTMDGIDSVVASGSIVEVPGGAECSILAATELELIEVQFGDSGLEEDHVSFSKSP